MLQHLRDFSSVFRSVRLLSALCYFQVSPLFTFFVPTGLGDHDKEVRKHMLDAALKAVNDHGKVTESGYIFIPLFWVIV